MQKTPGVQPGAQEEKTSEIKNSTVSPVDTSDVCTPEIEMSEEDIEAAIEAKERADYEDADRKAMRQATPELADQDDAVNATSKPKTMTEQERRVAAVSVQPHPARLTPATDSRRMINRALKMTEGDHPKPIKSYANLLTIMANDPDLRGLAFDAQTGRLTWAEDLPSWRGTLSQTNALSDNDLVFITRQVNRYYGSGFTFGRDRILDIITLYAQDPTRMFNPWLRHIERLPAWDGVHRLETMISAVDESEYTRRVFVNFGLSLMSRAFDPGCQMDSLLVFTGDQKDGKSRFFRAITENIPDLDHGTHETSVVPDSETNKDAMLAAHMSVICNFDEMDQISSKTDQKAMKATISIREDLVRVPYGRIGEVRPRRFIFAGTTNDPQFLTDNTGHRRYWAVKVVSRIPEEEFQRDYLDLLLSEARDRYRAGERVDYSDDFEEMADAARSGMVYDPVGELLGDWLDGPSRSAVDKLPNHGSDGNLLGKEINVDRVNAVLLRKHVPGLTPKAFNMSDRDLNGRITSYMDKRSDYEFKSSARGVYGYRPDVNAKRVWVKIDAGDQGLDVGATGEVTATPDGQPQNEEGPVQAPPSTTQTQASPYDGMADEVSVWVERLDLRNMAYSEQQRAYEAMVDSASSMYDTLVAAMAEDVAARAYVDALYRAAKKFGDAMGRWGAEELDEPWNSLTSAYLSAVRQAKVDRDSDTDD
ncbi:VapE family protein [Corynebacterium sp. USCH3]|uniref:VapE domain-containing protein n=1 Tax=Corynebacterium sp. USCH3 TaxID=3024840 RepID=UPI0030A8FB8D